MASVQKPVKAVESGITYASFYIIVGVVFIAIAGVLFHLFPNLRIYIAVGATVLILSYVAAASPNLFGFLLAIIAVAVLWVIYAYSEGWFQFGVELPFVGGPSLRPPDSDEKVILSEYIKQNYCREGEVFIIPPSVTSTIAKNAGVDLCKRRILTVCYEAEEYVAFVYPEITAVIDGIYKPPSSEEWTKLITGGYYVSIPDKNKTVMLRAEVYKRLIYPTTYLFDHFDAILQSCGVNSLYHVLESNKACILSKANWIRVV